MDGGVQEFGTFRFLIQTCWAEHMLNLAGLEAKLEGTTISTPASRQGPRSLQSILLQSCQGRWRSAVAREKIPTR